MAKGGGSSTVQKSEVSQSNLPEYARPYFENLMQRSQSLLGQGYVPYGQERIAGFTPEQQALQRNIGGLQSPGEFGTAGNLATAAGLGAISAGQYRPGTFNAQMVGGPALYDFQMEGPQQFGSQQAASYMSPFLSAALEPQMREAVTSARRSQVAQDLGSARQGSYGGSRQLLASMERERNLQQQMGDIQARGLQSGFESAQGQFNTEQGLRQQAGLSNLQARLGVQQLGATTGLEALRANQQANLEAQRMREQSRQFGAGQRLAGFGQAGQSAQTLANLGAVRQQQDLARLGFQQQTAAQNQALQQQYMDMAYQDFLRQRDYPLEMLQQYSSLLRGVPVTPNTVQTTYAPSPSVASQLMGAGLGAAGLYNMLNRPGG